MSEDPPRPVPPRPYPPRPDPSRPVPPCGGPSGAGAAPAGRESAADAADPWPEADAEHPPPRLFTAVWPPATAVEHLAAVLGELPPRQVERLRRFRRTPPGQWHVTLRFHGPADPAPLAAELDLRVPAAGPAPRLRLAGAGTFRGVLWIGVEAATEADTRGLHELVRIAGGDPGGFRAHLTVARWNAGRPDPARLVGPLSGYAGPWWDVAEVALVRSDPGPSGARYRALHAVPVPRRAAGDQGGPLGP